MSSQQSPEEDLLPKIKGAYRLLALFTEQGSNGLVDKVVIPQDSLRNLIDVLRPGAFESMTNINFAALDEVLLKPVGIYGSKSRIVEFLEEVNAIDTPTAKELLMPLPLNGVPPGPYLRTGIYLILDGLTQQREHSMDLDAGLVQPAFLLYWPEENTWDDDAVGDITRNRTTFMHYLGQLSNQLVALLSKEHADSIVWDGDAANIAEGEVPDSDESDDDLVFQFVVQKTVEQEESVKVHEGFEIPISSELLSTVDPDPQHAGELDVLLKPRVVLGDTRQALLVTEFIPQRRNPKKITAHISGMALQKKLTDNGNSIRLADDLRVEALEILIENGLENHFKSLCEDYKETKRREELMVQQEFQSLCAGAEEALASDTQRLEHHISNQLVQHLVNMYP
ncbi:uncharacterized protein EI90DRAFT_1729010 [Cantharellus anzutake]|uniref:uncharacterized protein n=1 Tax=Cantharellus anzutake TaxID=1750568 RepID=UPI001903BAAA|nr:uncharacterized protein EI90DRAFT_1729010 [Cantharellus anzutake]KAF8341371.1 hypothetical protein EI90DRAFT_1729010 [Cantharellus anzutake]